jgi:hypothetical protein
VEVTTGQGKVMQLLQKVREEERRGREWRGEVITCDGPSPQLKSLGSYEYHFDSLSPSLSLSLILWLPLFMVTKIELGILGSSVCTSRKNQ